MASSRGCGGVAVIVVTLVLSQVAHVATFGVRGYVRVQEGRRPYGTPMGRPVSRRAAAATQEVGPTTPAEAEATIFTLLGPTGRVALPPSDERTLAACLAALTTTQRTPATAADVAGAWRLLYTSKSEFDARSPLGRRVDGTAPGVEAVFDAVFFKNDQAASSVVSSSSSSSSPIQRAVTGLSAVDITQVVDWGGETDADAPGRVDQFVALGDTLRFRLSAAATFDEATGRLDFGFDLAYLDLFGGRLRVPYPVPFRLLGDEARGFLETIYVSDALRVARGNKGTTFVLKRIDPAEAR